MSDQPSATLAQRLGAAANRAFAREDAEHFREVILELEMEGVRSHRGIATTLNARGVLTQRGGLWHPTTVARLLRHLGWDTPSFFGTPGIARATIMMLDAWTFIPFMMIMLLAGLQSLDREVLEAARVDGASRWQGFWGVTFPLMLPVSMTALNTSMCLRFIVGSPGCQITGG